MKFTVLCLFLFCASIIHGQSYLGPCCDANGIPTNEADYSLQRYSVKRFKKKTPIHIHISTIISGSDTIHVDLDYSANIKSETPVIPLTESIGIKLVLATTSENNRNQYLYKLIVFERQTYCWNSNSVYGSFYHVQNQTFNLSGHAYGYEDDPKYFKLYDGYVKLN